MSASTKKKFRLQTALWSWAQKKSTIQAALKLSSKNSSSLKTSQLPLEELLPNDIQRMLETEQAYKKCITEIKRRLLSYEYFPQWLETLDKIFTLVKVGKLSGIAFETGIGHLHQAEIKIKNNTTIPLRHRMVNVKAHLLELWKEDNWTLKQYRF